LTASAERTGKTGATDPRISPARQERKKRMNPIQNEIRERPHRGGPVIRWSLPS
jgi:hypothetical protein